VLSLGASAGGPPSGALVLAIEPATAAIHPLSATFLQREVTLTATVTASAPSLRAAIDWGDAAPGAAPDVSTTTLVPQDNGTYTLVATHSYRAFGSFIVSISLETRSSMDLPAGKTRAHEVTNEGPFSPATNPPPINAPVPVQVEFSGGETNTTNSIPGPVVLTSVELHQTIAHGYDLVPWVRMADPRPVLAGVSNRDGNSSGGSVTRMPTLGRLISPPASEPTGQGFSGGSGAGANPAAAMIPLTNSPMPQSPDRPVSRETIHRSAVTGLSVALDDPNNVSTDARTNVRLVVYAELLRQGIPDDEASSGPAISDEYFAQLDSLDKDKVKGKGHGGEIVLLLVALAAVAPTGTGKMWRRM
jgi:hypothetical protein